MTNPILPDATIGVLGNGQLGRMMVMAAKRMGYRTVVFGQGESSPAGQVSDVEVNAEYNDEKALKAFAKQCDVITLEFENIPTDTVDFITEIVPVYPQSYVLKVAQNRVREKTTFKEAGLPVTPFRPVFDQEDLEKAIKKLGLPAVLKTAEDGYDGKGQFMIKDESQIAEAYASMGGAAAILEAFVDFEREVSVVVARNIQGDVACYPVADNSHENHILDVTVVPANVSPALEKEAHKIAIKIMQALEVVGVICVEFFVKADGALMINEIAPRPHNSGHWSIEGAVTSQYEQQVRAVCGLPLGKTDALRPCAMANLLGDVWENGAPNFVDMMRHFPQIKLHLYGKSAAKTGRKMGHLTVLANSTAEAAALVRQARDMLKK